MKSRPVFVVDDDDSVRDSIKTMLEAAGYEVQVFETAEIFLTRCDPAAGHCVITDIRMPGMDGLALQAELAARSSNLPIILITGHGSVPLAVEAMKAGAIDFLEKPFTEEELLASVQRALVEGRESRLSAEANAQAVRVLALLTPREREVFDQIVLGRSNKIAAHELGISPRTVEIHRAHLMHKLSARGLSDLVRLSLSSRGDHLGSNAH